MSIATVIHLTTCLAGIWISLQMTTQTAVFTEELLPYLAGGVLVLESLRVIDAFTDAFFPVKSVLHATLAMTMVLGYLVLILYGHVGMR